MNFQVSSSQTSDLGTTWQVVKIDHCALNSDFLIHDVRIVAREFAFLKSFQVMPVASGNHC